MTRAEALAEARRRWGSKGTAWKRNPGTNFLATLYCVSCGDTTPAGNPKGFGEGRDVDAAFADAARRAGGAS